MTAAMKEPAADLRWNVFQHTIEPELCCAVPPSQPVPAFLFSGQWQFSRRQNWQPEVMPDVGSGIAERAVYLRGFYLFHHSEAGMRKAVDALGNPASAREHFVSGHED